MNMVAASLACFKWSFRRWRSTGAREKFLEFRGYYIMNGMNGTCLIQGVSPFVVYKKA